MISLTGGGGFPHIFRASKCYNRPLLVKYSWIFLVNYSCIFFMSTTLFIFLVNYSLHSFNQIPLNAFSRLPLHFSQLQLLLWTCTFFFNIFISNPVYFQSIIPVYSWTSTSGETTATTSHRSTSPAHWWWSSPGSTSGWPWTPSPRGYPSVSSLSWPPLPRVLPSSPTYRKCPI